LKPLLNYNRPAQKLTQQIHGNGPAAT